MKVLFILLVAILLQSCSGFKQEQIKASSYPEIDKIFADQYRVLGQQLEKSVMLQGKEEIRMLTMDSTAWKEELSFLDELNPNQPEYVGAFDERKSTTVTDLKLKPAEKGALSRFLYEKEKGKIVRIQATIRENKDIFIHYREVSITFEDGLISEYYIHGYQKILFKDTISFKIVGKVAGSIEKQP